MGCKTWIYVIRCLINKNYHYYVGVTNRLKTRLREHSEGIGSTITDKNKYTHLCALYEVINFENSREYYENLLVLQLMCLSKNNWKHIKGGSWCRENIEKPKNINTIDKFSVCNCGFPKWDKCPKQMVAWYSKNIKPENYKCLDICENKYHHFNIFFETKCEFCNDNATEDAIYYKLCKSCYDTYLSIDGIEDLFGHIEKYQKKYMLICNHETKYFIEVFNNNICMGCFCNVFKKYPSPSVIFKENYDDYLEYIWEFYDKNDVKKDFFLEKTEQLEKYSNLCETKEIYKWYLYSLEKEVKNCKVRPRFLHLWKLKTPTYNL